MEKMTQEEALNYLKDEVHRMNLECVDPGPPCYTLAEMLARKDISTLQKIAECYEISDFSQMDTAAMVSALAALLSSPKGLAMALLLLRKHDWKLFCEASKIPARVGSGILNSHFILLMRVGLMGFYYCETDSQFYYIIPQEIQQTFRELEKAGFPAEKEHDILLCDYANAAVNLYGVITQADFVDIFNRQNNCKTDLETMLTTLRVYEYEDEGFRIWGEYLVNAVFGYDGFEDVMDYVESARKKPRYLPVKKEFLEFTNPDHLGPAQQIKALRNFLLRKMAADPDAAEDAIFEIAYNSRKEFHPREYLEILEKNGITPSDEQMNTLFPLIVAVQNNTRNWLNNGHTPGEIARKRPKGTDTLDDFFRPKKVGRNDPCPCGSGKKYKKCCGL